AVALVCIVFTFAWLSGRQNQTFAELADLHIATMASASPVDVVSTDRHTVKPWFQGKIPFTFNLPELANTQFTLEGGRLAYLDQMPGAQLIFKDGNHRISVFIFQKNSGSRFTSANSSARRLTFNMESWSEDGLQYFFISDVESADVHKLSELMRMAARSSIRFDLCDQHIPNLAKSH